MWLLKINPMGKGGWKNFWCSGGGGGGGEEERRGRRRRIWTDPRLEKKRTTTLKMLVKSPLAIWAIYAHLLLWIFKCSKCKKSIHQRCEQSICTATYMHPIGANASQQLIVFPSVAAYFTFSIPQNTLWKGSGDCCYYYQLSRAPAFWLGEVPSEMLESV